MTSDVVPYFNGIPKPTDRLVLLMPSDQIERRSAPGDRSFAGARSMQGEWSE